VKVNIKTKKADSDSETDTETEPDTDSETTEPDDTNNADKPVDNPTEDTNTDEDEEVSIQTKKFSNLKIQTVGLDNDRSMKFVNPSIGSMGITFKGTRAELNKLKEANIQLSVNVSQLEAGTHDVAVQVKAPDKTNWELDSRMVTISITDNEEETS
jgi:YbbR domain-containing protein